MPEGEQPQRSHVERLRQQWGRGAREHASLLFASRVREQSDSAGSRRHISPVLAATAVLAQRLSILLLAPHPVTSSHVHSTGSYDSIDRHNNAALEVTSSASAVTWTPGGPAVIAALGRRCSVRLRRQSQCQCQCQQCVLHQLHSVVSISHSIGSVCHTGFSRWAKIHEHQHCMPHRLQS